MFEMGLDRMERRGRGRDLRSGPSIRSARGDDRGGRKSKKEEEEEEEEVDVITPDYDRCDRGRVGLSWAGATRRARANLQKKKVRAGVPM